MEFNLIDPSFVNSGLTEIAIKLRSVTGDVGLFDFPSDIVTVCEQLSIRFTVDEIAEGNIWGKAYGSNSNIAASAFAHRLNLTKAFFPECSSIGYNAFTNCTSLQEISFPICKIISDGAFFGCEGLQKVIFPSCSLIGYIAFQNCTSLESAYFLGSFVPELADRSTFYRTLIASGTGRIYVRPSMHEAFCAAQNWSYYSSVITSYYEE